MFIKIFFSTIAATALFVVSASAICPGYNFGIAQAGGQTNGNNGVLTGQNPYKGGVLDCPGHLHWLTP
ncbi:hypothetical protein BKA82DRAFT_31840 [Pisolithus tinctorius]|uniref:Uncharacterized protein n=1 Tax=Pisolithus tinctorius Marx 270 TaxID=870435 RepID=A0A0C3N9Y1_PISTI|nr:hypothetical protein BKA82DRAFT_31840 [Pisolithus tinctorius]KIN97904.1 hypothetical protein M404DRAFT_31840 [Pisolithus tinctorius Marx 270]